MEHKRESGEPNIQFLFYGGLQMFSLKEKNALSLSSAAFGGFITSSFSSNHVTYSTDCTRTWKYLLETISPDYSWLNVHRAYDTMIFSASFTIFLFFCFDDNISLTPNICNLEWSPGLEAKITLLYRKWYGPFNNLKNIRNVHFWTSC